MENRLEELQEKRQVGSIVHDIPYYYISGLNCAI